MYQQYFRNNNKYRNYKVTDENGNVFDSRKEYNRYMELQLLEKAGEISDLKRQVRYELIPTHREPDTIGPRGGVRKGKVIESAVYYNADFQYKDKEGNLVVEDVKSPATRTTAYVIKRKLMLEKHGIRIQEL